MLIFPSGWAVRTGGDLFADLQGHGAGGETVELAGGREHDKLLYSIVNEFGGKFKGFRISRSFGAADRGEDRWFPAGFLRNSCRCGWGKQSVVLFSFRLSAILLSKAPKNRG